MRKTMSNGNGGIKVGAINAGAVYQLRLAGAQTDGAGGAIDSDLFPVHMSAVPALVGRDLAAAARPWATISTASRKRRDGTGGRAVSSN